MLLTYKENVHSTQMYIPLKPLFSRHKGIGVQFTDEPTGALDTETTKEIMKVFIDLNKQGKTIVIVTHDLAVAEQCGRVIKIEDGKMIE